VCTGIWPVIEVTVAYPQLPQACAGDLQPPGLLGAAGAPLQIGQGKRSQHSLVVAEDHEQRHVLGSRQDLAVAEGPTPEERIEGRRPGRSRRDGSAIDAAVRPDEAVEGTTEV